MPATRRPKIATLSSPATHLDTESRKLITPSERNRSSPASGRDPVGTDPSEGSSGKAGAAASRFCRRSGITWRISTYSSSFSSLDQRAFGNQSGTESEGHARQRRLPPTQMLDDKQHGR